MESHKPVDPVPYDRNKDVAEAGVRQSRLNARRALHYLGLDPIEEPGIYTAEKIRDFTDELADKLTKDQQ